MLATRGLDALKKIRELPPLPGAHAELKAEALAMGVDPKEALFTQDKATKPQVMILNDKRLADVQIVAFATHALVGGEIEGEKEPALVLTPPKVDSDADNGLLTLDDILGLRLDSDRLVLLSACDTAAPDGSGEGFSGLTSAFFFAGAPALLVSQWGVDDSATRHLMTDLLKKKDFVTRPSSALKSAMIDMIASTRAKRSFSNPFAWAAFILVGDDGRYRVPAFRTGKP